MSGGPRQSVSTVASKVNVVVPVRMCPVCREERATHARRHRATHMSAKAYQPPHLLLHVWKPEREGSMAHSPRAVLAPYYRYCPLIESTGTVTQAFNTLRMLQNLHQVLPRKRAHPAEPPRLGAPCMVGVVHENLHRPPAKEGRTGTACLQNAKEEQKDARNWKKACLRTQACSSHCRGRGTGRMQDMMDVINES